MGPPEQAGSGDDQQVEYEELDELAARLHLAVSASELHGSVCGFIAGGGSTSGGSLLEQLQLQADTAGGTLDPAGRVVLVRLVQSCAAALADSELGFEPLLPADDRPLAERAEATVEWCRGFLGGFGLTGAASHDRLSDEAKEMLHDLGAIAGSSFDYGDAAEDEDALIEVHEFMRVGALLLHAECAVPPAGARGTLH
ncbi:MAG: UPF0149 family protein [Xanthomonadales bacterium]|nr:UPF0149 family protein [Xanthomonadales bacterium]